MIIENLDALKTWLSKTLEPICDADPSALAKYVVALVKKDKSEKELKALCMDQLDVFLQKETQIFVDKLFEAVNAKSYLPQPELPTSASRTETHQRTEKDETKREELILILILFQLNYRRVDDHKKDDRSRKREYDRNPPRRDLYRERYNRRRERSRSRSRSWSKDRTRDRDRERDRSRSRSRTRSRSRNSGKPKYEHSRPERQEAATTDGYTATPLTPGNSSAHFPVPTLSSTITVIAPTHHGNNTTESWSEFPQDHTPFGRGIPPRKRCRDYDEKGFCMRGDMCPFDHGSDPVVVEDVNLPSILPFQPPPLPGVDGPPPPGLPPPHSLLTPPVNLRPPVPPPGTMPPSLPPVAGPPPPLPALQPSGMDAPPNSITSSVPTIVTSGVRPPITQPPPSLFTSVPFDQFNVYNPEAPSMTSRPMYRHRVNAQRPNLIGLTMGEVDLPPREKMLNSNSARIVLESDSRKRGAGMHGGAIPAKKPWFDKPNFNKPNHPSFHRRVPYSSANAKLAIRQIPPELNNISKLNEHFSKFGTIVNLQVAYNNDPEGALIQFASPEEAKRAMQSTEAVLNNRFIRVHWHREDAVEHTYTTPHPSIQTAQEPVVTTPKQSVKDRLGPLPTAHPEPSHDPACLCFCSLQNTTKASVKERLGLSKPAGFGGKVFSTSTGLTKTVYNPAALKAGHSGAPFGSATVSAEDALKRKQEALKLQHNVRKKKQEILEKHIQTQKLLISKLEKNRSMKAEDKALIMQTLTTFTSSITKLQEEMKGLSSANALKTTLKSKAQAQKELLDTELDLYKKIQAGEDTAELKIKYTQLQLEAAKRGLLTPGRGRGAHGRGRGGLRSRGRGRRVPTHAVVDHRPRALEIGGFTEADRVDLLPHFAQYGEIEDCQMEDSSLSAIITYKTRAEAEQAAIHGVRLNNQELRLAWHKPTASLNTTDPDEVEPEDEEVRPSSQFTLRVFGLLICTTFLMYSSHFNVCIHYNIFIFAGE
uniref:RNA-binding protein 26-like n=1 Tax=Sinocyclocheilus rhinocerous TaxID=307959 RepID=A0A673IKK2_9TELE